MKVWIVTEEITDYDQDENPYKLEDEILKVFDSKEKAESFKESKSYTIYSTLKHNDCVVHECEVE